MKYSILGFNQKAVLATSKLIQKTVKGEDKLVHLKLDITDLLILQHLADFPNRKRIVKTIIDDKMFFWVDYKTLIEELPILDIKKQALSDRLSKLVELDILEKHIISQNGYGNSTFFRMGEKYESLKYSKEDELQYESEKEECSAQPMVADYERVSYSTTKGYRSQLQDNNNIINNNTTNKEKEIDKSISKKDDFFEQCWKEYKRKGSKAKAKIQWNKLSQEEKDKVITHIKAYVQSRELQYQKDFERYLKDKIFDTLVIANNNIIYDPTMFNANEYRPTLTSQLFFQNELRTYIYIGFWDGFISDGYNDNNRPNGASIMLNNGRGTIIWNKNSKQWILTK